MRSNTAGSKTRQITRGPLGIATSLLNRLRIKAKDLSDALHKTQAAKARPSVAERQEELILFYDRYEAYVEVLCDAAQYGPSPKLEHQYDETRQWMRQQYPDVRTYLRAYLRPTAEAAAGDPFETLLASETLQEFLQSDDGDMIARITRTREALNLYAEHLRQLADKTA